MKKRYPFSPKTWRRAGLLTTFAASLSFNVQAQTAPAKQWDKAFGGSDDDQLYSLRQTSDGGYILGGHSRSGIGGDKSQPNYMNGTDSTSDFWVVKLDASGSKTWDKTFGGSWGDGIFSLQQTSDGGYILGGYSNSPSGGDKSQTTKGAVGTSDYWVIKLDASGNKLWDKTFGGSLNEEFRSLQQTSDGGYILGGHSESGISGDKTQTSQGGLDYWVVKMDGNGNKIWDKTFGGRNDEYFSSLQQTSDGGYILGGWSESGISGDKSQASKGDTDLWIVKLDASGNKTWDKTFGGSDKDGLYYHTLQQTSDGGYILGGSSNSPISADKSQASKGGSDYWVVKLDVNGNKTWDKTFGGSGNDGVSSLLQTSDGGYILGGWSDSGNSGDKTQASQGGQDYWIVKLDGSGNKTWDKTLGGNYDDFPFSLQQTSDGGYILGGYSQSGISGDKSQASKGMFDFWIVKLAGNVTGLKESEANLAVSIFPNPSQGKFKLQLSGITAPSVGVTVSDMLGRAVLQQELQVTNQHISQELELPAANGIYLLQLKAGEQITTRKIVVK